VLFFERLSIAGNPRAGGTFVRLGECADYGSKTSIIYYEHPLWEPLMQLLD
jgi:hypothetical protein